MAGPYWSKSLSTSRNEEIDAIDHVPPRALRWGPDPGAVREAATMLLRAKRPVLYVGQGVHWAQAWSEVAQLSELLSIPVCAGRVASTQPKWAEELDGHHPVARHE